MNTKILAAILLAMLGVSFAAIHTTHGTTISPPQKIQLEGGSEDSKGNWTGGYWTFTVAIDQADSLVGKVVLPANTSVKTTDKDGDEIEVKTKVSVELQFYPEKAYYKRLLKKAPIEDRLILPKYYRGGENKITTLMYYEKTVSIDAVMSPHYEWAEASWQKYTVWKVKVFVEGQLVGESSMNTEQGTKDFVVKTNKGNVLIKHLGRLQGDYGEPEVPSGAVIFNEQYVYESDALNYIRYDHGGELKRWDQIEHNVRVLEGSDAYSVYWTGNVRWTPKEYYNGMDEEVQKTPAPYNLVWWGMAIRDGVKGWKCADDFWNYVRDPVAPAIFPADETEDIANYDCLIEYLNRKTSKGNIADEWLDGYDGWHIEYKDGEAQAVIVDVPWGAYSGVPIATCFVPTELAETWVYRVPIADIRIESVQWQEGTKSVSIVESKKCSVTVKQYAKVLSSAVIYAEVSSSRASISPKSITITLDKNQTATYWFEVKNLGVSEDVEGNITFIIKRSWDNVETDRNSDLSFKLLAPSPDMTIVTVLVVDKSSKQPVQGIMVYCSPQEGEVKQGLTGSSGIVTFNLGTFRGTVTFKTEETSKYHSATISQMVSGNAEITIEILKKEISRKDKSDVINVGFPWWIIIAVIGGAAMVITLILIRRKISMENKMFEEQRNLYRQYCNDMGIKPESVVSTGVKLGKKGWNFGKKTVKEGLGFFGIKGKTLHALKVMTFGIILIVIGMYWMSTISPFISSIAPWLPQGFSIPIKIPLGIFGTIDTGIYIGFYIFFILFGILFFLIGLKQLVDYTPDIAKILQRIRDQ